MDISVLKNFSKQFPIWLRWLRFNLSGIAGVFVQMTVLSFTRNWLGLNYLLATAIAVECALLHNFMWHEFYTWQELKLGRRWADTFGRFVRFNMTVGAFSLIGNVILMRLLVGGLNLPLLVANLFAIAALSVGNFLISEYHVFREQVAGG